MNVLFPIYIRANHEGLDTKTIENLLNLYCAKWSDARIQNIQVYNRLEAFRNKHPDMSEETRKTWNEIMNFVKNKAVLLKQMENEYYITRDWIRKKKNAERLDKA